MTTTETTPLIPSFGAAETDRKLAIICSKGTLDMAYPGLILANAALGEGIETHLFFTFWGMTLLLVGTFSISGLHTLMWLPRALQMRKQHLAEEAVLEIDHIVVQ